METHQIIVRGRYEEARLKMIKDSLMIMQDALKKNPKTTCNLSMYFDDVTFLVDLICGDE